MNKRMKCVCGVIVFTLIGATGSFADEMKKSSTPAYLLSIFVGFGTGHFYIEDEKAKTFLGLEIAAAGGVIAGTAIATVAMIQASEDILEGSTTFPPGVVTGLGIAGISSFALSGIRLWELIDIFGAVDEKRAEGKVVLTPSLDLKPNAVSLVLSVNY